MTEQNKYACKGKYFVNRDVCGNCNYNSQEHCGIVKMEKKLEKKRRENFRRSKLFSKI